MLLPFLFFIARAEGGLIDLKAHGQIPDTTSPIFSDSPPPPPTSYLPLSHFDHYESTTTTTTISASPVLPAETIEPVVAREIELEAQPAEAEVVEMAPDGDDDKGGKHELELRAGGDVEVKHVGDIALDFDELDEMHALSAEPMVTDTLETEHIERAYELVQEDDVEMKGEEEEEEQAAKVEPLIDVDAELPTEEPEERMLVSTENVEQELEATAPVELEGGALLDEPMAAPDVAAQLEELHRLKSSSYEDIYKETDFKPEKPGPPPETVEVGDRFDSKHEEDLFGLSENGKSSSFENVYTESKKEAGDVEEKDVDEYEIVEREVEADLAHPEKGAAENEKHVVAEDELERAEQYDAFDADLTKATAMAPPAPPVDDSPETLEPTPTAPTGFPAPIDGTYESGLDHVGQEEEPLVASAGSDALNRSLSCDAEQDVDSAGSSSPRQRHFSSPDETMHKASLEDIVGQQGKGTDGE